MIAATYLLKYKSSSKIIESAYSTHTIPVQQQKLEFPMLTETAFEDLNRFLHKKLVKFLILPIFNFDFADGDRDSLE